MRPALLLHRDFIEMTGGNPGSRKFVFRRIHQSEKDKQVPVWLSGFRKGKSKAVDIILGREMVVMKNFRFDPASGKVKTQAAQVVHDLVPWKPEEIVFDCFEILPDGANTLYAAVVAPRRIFCEYLDMVKKTGMHIGRVSVSSLENRPDIPAQGTSLFVAAGLETVELAVYEEDRLLFCRAFTGAGPAGPREFDQPCRLFARDFRREFPDKKIKNIHMSGEVPEHFKNSVREVWGFEPEPAEIKQTSGAQSIQLLPPEELARQEKARWCAQVIKTAAPLAGLILIWGLYGHIMQLNLIRKAEALEVQAARMHDQAREAAGIVSLWKETQERQTAGKDFISGMTALLEMTPPDIYFQEVNFRGGRFFLDGIAEKQESVRGMQDFLQQSRRFARVKTGTVSRHKVLRKDWYRFQMEVEL